jgi:hypothetical protein
MKKGEESQGIYRLEFIGWIFTRLSSVSAKKDWRGWPESERGEKKKPGGFAWAFLLLSF